MIKENSSVKYLLLGILAIILSSTRPILTSARTQNNPFYVVLDINSGNVIAESYPDHPWNPASLTKLMTAYIVFSLLEKKQATLTTPIVISKNAAGYPPSNSTLKQGSIITLDNALKLLIVKSANDIAVAIAESLCKTEAEFVKNMNALAIKMGLSSTHFMNSHGHIQYAHYTTARDVAILSWKIKSDFPQYAHYFKIEGITVKENPYPNTNWAIGVFPGADGMKSGFTCASGFNLVVSATQNEKSLVVVVLGAIDRDQRNKLTEKLLFTGFSYNINKKIDNYIEKNSYHQNLSNEVPDISKIVCTSNNELNNYRIQLKEAQDKEKYKKKFFAITSLSNPKINIKKQFSQNFSTEKK
ncbi:MAG: D-alanyl-D-alanine carboxypeptidase [Candidatus Liberibacter ctenarytainae]|uniref:D-alanyl-D-alanine carboxypeptidase n=1 Tax=Candidatus Liberibacter ctenarytainae TaxID=2020335 RepID=A0A937DLQ8_9HYPH|nr:D-alanyl-D-alanine carboxypeptidase [Candidatus Liberibacter ctenarytainae]